MSTLQDLWNEYWWILPVALMLLCLLGCTLGGRRGRAGCCPCAPRYGPRQSRRW